MVLFILLLGKITELLSSDSVDLLTKLILVNAIYFKGNWDDQFDKQQTKERPFKVSKVNLLQYQRRFLETVPVFPLVFKTREKSHLK